MISNSPVLTLTIDPFFVSDTSARNESNGWWVCLFAFFASLLISGVCSSTSYSWLEFTLCQQYPLLEWSIHHISIFWSFLFSSNCISYLPLFFIASFRECFKIIWSFHSFVNLTSYWCFSAWKFGNHGLWCMIHTRRRKNYGIYISREVQNEKNISYV